MIQKIVKIILLITVFCRINIATAAIEIHESGGMIYIENATVTELEQLFSKFNYNRFHLLKNNAYPALFVKTLPSDFAKIKQANRRNELFIRILVPLALKINEEILNERSTLLRLERHYQQTGKLSAEEIKKLEKLALKYDYFTRKKGNDRIATQLTNLKRRINVIPPSIFVATAAMETNWGTSRIAQQANSLYKEKIWYTDEGLTPEENPNDGYKFKIFDSLSESMRSFALNFNSDIKYKAAWITREQMLLRRDFLLGESMAYSLSSSSNLPNFAGIINYTTAFYDLQSLDLGELKKGLKYEP